MDRPDGERDAAELGSAAELLFADGKVKAAALLIDARIVARDYMDTAFPQDESPGFDVFQVTLEVPRFLVERFDDEVVADTIDALNEVMNRDHVHVARLEIRAAITPAASNWRETLQARMEPRPTNQASVGPPPVEPLWEDRCAFRSREELRVYRAFKTARDRLPADDSIAIAPNPALVLHNVNTSEPDLVVMYRGRVGIVQVDGPHHRGASPLRPAATGCIATAASRRSITSSSRTPETTTTSTSSSRDS